MKSATVSILLAALLADASGSRLQAREAPRKSSPGAAPPPPPIFTPAKEPAPSAAEIEREARQHTARLAMDIERALFDGDARLREAVFTFLLPELLQVDAPRVVAMVERQQPGEARDTLRGEVARQWVARDRDAAVAWMKSLPSAAERRDSAREAMQSLAAVAPDHAIYVAEQFGLGRDDGSLVRLVRIWAERDLPGAERWVDRQPDGPHTEQLRSALEQARAGR